jgi:hypothetical protein
MKGDYITGIGLYCSWLNSDGTTGSVSTTEVRGNNGGTYWDNLVCPPNKALTKLSGTAWNYVDTIRGGCTYVDGSEYSETGLEGEGGTNYFDSPCPPGYFVTGLMIKWGDYIDGLTMICNQVLKK